MNVVLETLRTQWGPSQQSGDKQSFVTVVLQYTAIIPTALHNLCCFALCHRAKIEVTFIRKILLPPVTLLSSHGRRGS